MGREVMPGMGFWVRGYCNPVFSNWAMSPRTRSVALSKSDQLPPLNWSDFERATERVPGILQLGHVPANPLGGPFEIRPVQGWQLVAIGHSIESHPLCGRVDRLEIRRSQPAETAGNIFDCQPTFQASALEIEPEQSHSLGSFRRRDQKLLGKPAASKYSRDRKSTRLNS